MGLDVVEIVMAVETTFQIEVPVESTADLWRGRNDIQVRDFVAMIVDLVKQQNPAYEGDVVDMTRRIISEFAGSPFSLVSIDALFKHDLNLI